MSEVELYATEAKFNDAKTKYVDLMNTLQTSCLGTDRTTDQCQQAAELNATMQTYLIQMSNLIKKTHRPLVRQQELFNVSGQLEVDQEHLLTNIAKYEDLNVLATSNHEKYIAWWLSGITVSLLVMYAWPK